MTFDDYREKTLDCIQDKQWYPRAKVGVGSKQSREEKQADQEEPLAQCACNA